MDGCLEEGSALTQPNTIILAGREKYGEVGRLPRTKHGKVNVETWSVTDEKPSYPMSDSASRIRQNASMEIDVAISHENCKFEYFCHYTRFDYNVRLFISPGEK